MRPWTTWLYGLGLSGALAFGLTGCGGGDVPDPESDELAGYDEGGDPAADAEMPPPPIAPPAPAPAPAPGGDAPPALADAPAPAPAPAPTAPDAAPAPAPGGDAPPAAADAQAAKSETAELLALGSGAAAPAPSLADAPPAEPTSPFGGPGAPGMAEMAPGREADPSMLANPGALGSADMLGPRGPGGPLGEGDSSLGSAGPGTPGGASELKPGDTNTATGAVEAFLYALSRKDRDRLMEATALRSTTQEEGGRYRELFSRILDVSISDAELDDLASKLEGYRVAGAFNQVKTTGRQGVTVRKNLKDGGWLQRTVTVRREKKGWGVLDISNPTEFDNIRVRNMRRR